MKDTYNAVRGRKEVRPLLGSTARMMAHGATLHSLVDRLAGNQLKGLGVIPWGSPVPVFGDLGSARIATLGLNPSNREFVDKAGKELNGSSRRFHTLLSLALSSWGRADDDHIALIGESCRVYFERNPYDRWFGQLDVLLRAAGASYYQRLGSVPACHLDLIPYATSEKWTALTRFQQIQLLQKTGDALGRMLKDSSLTVLVLNGRAVIEQFTALSDARLTFRNIPEWTLGRRSGNNVSGFAISGVVTVVAGVQVGRPITVLGFNHNIQSSYGVTSGVRSAIAAWLSGECSVAIDEA